MTEMADKIDEFFSRFPERTYPKGQILIFADENPEYIFYITSGKVIAYDISYRGDEVITNIFKQPAFFPMAWAINRTPNRYFYKTDAATTLRIAPIEETLNFLKANPDVTLDLLGRVYRGMDGILGRLVHLMSGTAKSRLLYELLIECRRFGDIKSDGSCVLTITEQAIAMRAGLSRETVSREMRKIKDAGLVSLDKNSLTIHNVAAIESDLGHDA